MGLDPNQRQEIRDLISKLGQDHTVLLSTHVMQEVEAICQRVIILNKGTVAEDGTVDEVTKSAGVNEDELEIEIAFTGSSSPAVESTLQERFEIVGSDNDFIVVKTHKSNVHNQLYHILWFHNNRHLFV